jgi:hypothetical protein
MWQWYQMICCHLQLAPSNYLPEQETNEPSSSSSYSQKTYAENCHRLHTWYQQNELQSLETSRSVWEDVECKLRSVNFRRALDSRRVFQSALGVTGISHDAYRSTMEVIVISLGIHRSNGEKIGCSWECCWTNVGITSKLWAMPRFSWIFIQRTAGVIGNSPDVQKQLISPDG